MSSQDNSKSAPQINTSYPGFIYDFNPAEQTCSVQLAIETLFVGYADAYKLEPKQRLQKVPVQFIQGGGWSLTHPVPDGTPCYVHFAQRGLDHWLVDGKDSAGMRGSRPAPAFAQQFDLNSAVCTIGTQPIPKAIGGFNNGALELRNGNRSQRVTLSDSKIEIFQGSTKITLDGSSVVIEATGKVSAKAPEITLDGDTTVTKSLTVLGGMAVSGGSGSQMSVTGNVDFKGSLKVNGVEVDKHTHTNPEGGNVGPMQ